MSSGFALLLAILLGVFAFIVGVAWDDKRASTGVPALVACFLIVAVFAINVSNR